MNTLEDRLREALRERAGRSPVSPDAWSRTLARTRRHVWGPAWTRFMIPAAAAAAIVAIIVGAAVLTGNQGQHGGSRQPGSTTAPASATPPAPPGPNEYLMKGTPPVTAVVPIKLTAGGKTTWTFVWFGYMKSARDQGIALCTVTGGPNAIRLGTAVKQVTSAAALLPGGRRVPGVLVSGRGFPYKVWAVTYPQPSNAQVVFADASGRRLGQLSIRGDFPTPRQPRTGGISVFRYPAGTVEPSAGTMTAYLLDGRVEGVGGHVVGFWDSSSSSAVSVVPAGGPPAVEMFGGGFGPHTTQVYVYGYAHENVRRVVLRLADGKQYGAQTFAAWAGSGLRLWDFSVPASLRSSLASADLRGYDAAGQVIWQKAFPAAAP